jgi:hypothetical protein
VAKPGTMRGGGRDPATMLCGGLVPATLKKSRLGFGCWGTDNGRWSGETTRALPRPRVAGVRKRGRRNGATFTKAKKRRWQ